MAKYKKYVCNCSAVNVLALQTLSRELCIRGHYCNAEKENNKMMDNCKLSKNSSGIANED